MYCSRRYLLEVVQSGNIPVAYVRWMGIRTAVHASVFNYCNRVMHGMPVRPFSQACEASLGSTLSLSPARTSIKVVRIQHDGCHKIPDMATDVMCVCHRVDAESSGYPEGGSGLGVCYGTCAETCAEFVGG